MTTSEEFAQRPEDFDPDGSVDVVTLALTPYDVQQLVMAMDLGEVTLVLRQFGEDTVVPIENYDSKSSSNRRHRDSGRG